MKFIHRLTSLLGGGGNKATGAPRIMAYCASNIGLGHYCRILRVLDRVRQELPKASLLLATDARDSSMAAEAGVAVLQLPRFHFIDQEEFKEGPELLHISSPELRNLRARILLAAGESYRPQVLLMDTKPHGKRDEVLPLIKVLHGRGGCQILLMMPDIPSPPGERFKLSGPPSDIRKHGAFYDRLLVAGDERFFDAAEAYHWPGEMRAKLAYLGFGVPPLGNTSRVQAFAPYPDLDPQKPTVAASFGGGWQSDQHAGVLLESIRLVRQRTHKPVQLVMSLGPAATAEHHRAIVKQAEALGGVVVELFSSTFPILLRHVDLAILQAGDSPVQLLDSDIPILLTPRPYKSREQEERAQRLATWPGVRLIEGATLTTHDCAEWITLDLARERRKRNTGYCFDGINNAAREVMQALETTRQI